MFLEKWNKRWYVAKSTRRRKTGQVAAIEWPFKEAYERASLALIHELDQFAEFITGIRALKDQLGWAEEVFSVSIKLRELVSKVENEEITIDSMNELVGEQAESLEDILDNRPSIFCEIKGSANGIEDLIDDLEEKIEALAEPVRNSGDHFFHVLNGAA